MAYTAGVDTFSAEITAFKAEYKLEAQQMESRLQSLVKNESFTGTVLEDTYKSKIATTDVIVNRATGADTAIKDTGFVTRRVIVNTYTYPTLLAEKDVVKMLKDPKGEIVQSIKSALNRTRDGVILTAMIGNASTKDNTTGAWSDVALPAGQIIEDVPATALTVDKLRAIKILLDKAEQPMEERYIAVSSTVLDGLLGETEVTSSDYNVVKTLVQGEIDTFLGFKFVRLEGVTDDYVVAWQKNGVLYGKNEIDKIDIEKTPGKYMDWTIQIEEQYGALRREDTAVVKAGILIA